MKLTEGTNCGCKNTDMEILTLLLILIIL